MAIKTTPIEHPVEQKPKSKKGFASMTPERRREIARNGGLALKDSYTFSQNSDLARKAGSLGGKKSKRSKGKENVSSATTLD